MSKRILVIGLLVFALSFAMVGTSFAITTSDITATNNAGVSDKVYVINLAAGDTVKVYPSPTGTAVVLGRATARAVAAGVYNATITVKQLIPNTSTSQKTLYVGVTPKGSTTETTPRTSFTVDLEQKTDIASVSSNTPVITNNGLGVLDTVYISGLLAGDIVKLYDDTKTIVFAKATAAKSGSVTLKYKDLGTDDVYFTVARTKPTTGPSTSESAGFKGPFTPTGEVQTVIVNTTPTLVSQVYPSIVNIKNNYGVADTVYIYGLLAGDVVKLYNTNIITPTTLPLAKATAAKVQGTGYSSVTLKVKQLNSTTGSVNVYFTVTRTKPTSGPSQAQSAVSAAQPVAAEGKATLTSGQISVVNNKVGTADKVTVTGLIVGDIVKVYASDFDETVIGKATVASGSTQAVVSIRQLGTGADSVFVTVTRMKPLTGPTLAASDRASATYIAELP